MNNAIVSLLSIVIGIILAIGIPLLLKIGKLDTIIEGIKEIKYRLEYESMVKNIVEEVNQIVEEARKKRKK